METSLSEARYRLQDLASPIALIGASNNPDKYGNIIFRNLRERGYQLIPVNPREAEVEGVACIADAEQLQPPIGIANFVVPPRVSEKIVRAWDRERCDMLWFQPGSFDDTVISLAKERVPYVLAGDCIMVVAAQITPKSAPA